MIFLLVVIFHSCVKLPEANSLVVLSSTRNLTILWMEEILQQLGPIGFPMKHWDNRGITYSWYNRDGIIPTISYNSGITYNFLWNTGWYNRTNCSSTNGPACFQDFATIPQVPHRFSHPKKAIEAAILRWFRVSHFSVSLRSRASVTQRFMELEWISNLGAGIGRNGEWESKGLLATTIKLFIGIEDLLLYIWFLSILLFYTWLYIYFCKLSGTVPQ